MTEKQNQAGAGTLPSADNSERKFITFDDALSELDLGQRALLDLAIRKQVTLYSGDAPVSTIFLHLIRAFGRKYGEAYFVLWAAKMALVCTVEFLMLLLFRSSIQSVPVAVAISIAFVVVLAALNTTAVRYPHRRSDQFFDLKVEVTEIRRLRVGITDSKDVVQGPPIDIQLPTKSRSTALKLIIGMAINGYGYDPSAKKSPIAKELSDELAKLGLSVDDDTIRNWLNEAKETVYSDRKV